MFAFVQTAPRFCCHFIWILVVRCLIVFPTSSDSSCCIFYLWAKCILLMISLSDFDCKRIGVLDDDDADDDNNCYLYQNVRCQSKLQFFLLLWAMSAIDVLWKWNANVYISEQRTFKHYHYFNVKEFKTIPISNAKQPNTYSFCSVAVPLAPQQPYLHCSMCSMYSYLNI